MESIDMAMLEKVGVVAVCLGISYLIVKHICTYLKIDKDPVIVLFTAAAGEIGYALAPMIAKGHLLGDDQPVILHLLDRYDDESTTAAEQALEALRMELLDSAFPLLQGVVATTDVAEACKGVDIAIMLDELPAQGKHQGMERKGVVAMNLVLYKAYASALHKHASDDCKVVVVGNMANTNALVLKDLAPSIQRKNITCLTRLHHNRALAHISEKLGVHVSDVKNVVVWGIHSSNVYPDANHAVVATNKGPKHALELMDTDHKSWLNGEFIAAVQQRSAAVIKAQKLPIALSVANAICDHIHDWILGTPKGAWVSMGVSSDGSYGIEEGLFYSFPVTCHKGEWSIVQGLKISELSRKKMDDAMKEITQEREVAYACMTT